MGNIDPMKPAETTRSVETIARIVLPEALDIRAASPLASRLLSARGAAVELDASRVTGMGAQCLQVILSAKLTWRRDGHSFAIINPARAFLDSLTEAALPAEQLLESDIDA